MTRKDYEMLSRVFREEVAAAKVFNNTSIRLSVLSQCAKGIGESIARDNKAFDVARFMRECELA